MRSGFEKKTLGDLDKRGVSYAYEPFKVKYQFAKERTYTPDVVLANGLIIELKGLFTSMDRVKHLFIQKSNPDLDIRFVFQRAKNRLSRESKTTYAAWCEKHGFKWADGSIPQEWIDEPPRVCPASGPPPAEGPADETTGQTDSPAEDRVDAQAQVQRRGKRVRR